MLKKGDKFKFTCLGIAEATPDFILYRVKEDNGESDRYLEKYNKLHLIPNNEYEAVVTDLSIFEYRLAIKLSVTGVSDSENIHDRVMYKPLWWQYSLLKGTKRKDKELI